MTSNFMFCRSEKYAVITSLCHVERPLVKAYCSVSLSCPPINGVETSACGYRCFDSVYSDLTTLIVNSKSNALVAQHDKLGEDVLNCNATTSMLQSRNSLRMRPTHLTSSLHTTSSNFVLSFSLSSFLFSLSSAL